MSNEITETLIDNAKNDFRKMLRRYPEVWALFRKPNDEGGPIAMLFVLFVNVIQGNSSVLLVDLITQIVETIAIRVGLNLPHSTHLRTIVEEIVALTGAEQHELLVDRNQIEAVLKEKRNSHQDVQLMSVYRTIHVTLKERAGVLRSFVYSFHDWIVKSLHRTIEINKRVEKLIEKADNNAIVEEVVVADKSTKAKVYREEEIELQVKSGEVLFEKGEVQYVDDAEMLVVDGVRDTSAGDSGREVSIGMVNDGEMEEEEEVLTVPLKAGTRRITVIPSVADIKKIQSIFKQATRKFMRGGRSKKAKEIRRKLLLDESYDLAISALLNALRIRERARQVRRTSGRIIQRRDRSENE